ncbi:amino acid--tRNA ligase-related protein, partial [Psychrobacter proteolyticus]|uniref:amino acid--tRNA ligase-related protein n=1 Tax=Psychrobacter proteolyticus TaxID=147825 RepID=UPI00311D99A8
VDIANAYYELADVQALHDSFEQDNQLRASHNLPQMTIDEYLLDASNDLKPCSGIAVGMDRLIMVLTGASSMEEVIPIPRGKA